VLRTTYLASGVTAIAVHADGIVAQVWRDLDEGERLEPTLSRLESPGSPSA